MQGQVRFAVDLGTSNTVAVVDRGDGTPRPLLFDGNPLLPSAVFADASGTVFVGRDAERHMATDAARYEPNPKGHIDEGLILLGDREVPVVELLAAILRRVAAEAAQTGVLAGGTTVLTCPADWGPRRRAVLQEAAGVAGLGRVTLLDEPVAAATYCMRVLGSRIAPGRSVAVFDFGGGTLDVTVAQATPDGLRVLATGGLDDLGGTDVDAALVGHLGQQVAAHDGELWRRLQHPQTPADFRDRMTFWSEVRAAKEMLSRAASAPVHVPGVDQATHLTREELDRVAGPLVDRAVDETRRVLQRSGVPAAQLDAILLVGGSSRLPLVASRLHARFGLAPVVPEQPELPVAYGALLLGNTQAAGSVGSSPAATGYGAPVTPAGGYPASASFQASAPPAPYQTSAPPAAYQPSAPPAAYQASAPPAAYQAPAATFQASVPPAAYQASAPPAYQGAAPSAYQAPAAYQGPPAGYAAPAGYPPPAGYAPQEGYAPQQQPVVPQQRQQRPSVIIGPGVTMQGNVAIYGDEDLMPQYARDEPHRRTRDEPPEPPADPPARARRSGSGFSISRMFWRLRLIAVPVVIVLALTPWGRGLLSAGRDKISEWTGSPSATPTVAVSTSTGASPAKSSAPAAAGPSVKLVPDSVKAGTSVKVTGAGFDKGEQVAIKVNGTQKIVKTSTAAGAVEWNMPTATLKKGPTTVELVGATSKRSAKATLEVTA
ncbi:Hsp70 family protein [Dactylosporangium sp. NPDC049525]|uniref:Hsp70 family protein n=1 Tax=Dactylosporangium sp. NPDC049525 TaxID=3154730 RepID=UPI003439EF55